ncbi:MAG: transcription elongation factor GreA [Deltaproteobacteria bacterium HGW-Deltaproteobacteria-17]|nr:MAG: transcription elongation factor GreA [Deltaproteobacteria bacterium HGW-Deltaproteobacteria-17]
MTRVPMTPEGFARLTEELARIKNVEVPKNIKDIEEAREHGDLRENAEYHAAKDKQGHLAARQNYLQDRLARAEVIDPKTLKSDRVVFGATVTLENEDTGEITKVKIVGEDEADPNRGMINLASPMAKAMIGKSVDDEVKLKTSQVQKTFYVLKIEFV